MNIMLTLPTWAATLYGYLSNTLLLWVVILLLGLWVLVTRRRANRLRVRECVFFCCFFAQIVFPFVCPFLSLSFRPLPPHIRLN